VGSYFALSGLIFRYYITVSQGFATVLSDFALSGLYILKVWKERNELAIGRTTLS
jgi:hypothetical protein